MDKFRELEQEALEYKAAAQKMLDEAGPEGLDSVQNAAFENLRGKIEATQAIANELKNAEIDRLTGLAADDQSHHSEVAKGGDFRDMAMGVELELIKDALAEASGSGSYLVGQEWASRVAEYRFQRNFLREAGAQVIATSTTHDIPILTANGAADITAENAVYTAVDPTIANVVLKAYKFTQKIPVSEELLSDAMYDLPGLLARSVGIGFAAAEEKYFMVGTGTAQPTGIFNKAADATLAGTTAITKDELIAAVYSLARQYREGAAWMMNDSTVLLIADLSVVHPVFLPVPGKGNVFYEDIPQAGASVGGQVYAQMGLDYGPETYHGTLTALTAS